MTNVFLCGMISTAVQKNIGGKDISLAVSYVRK